MSYSCISVVGLGYIGLPTAAVLASQKNKVVGIDVNQDTVDIINSGKVHIVEPGLDTIVNRASITNNAITAALHIVSIGIIVLCTT